jgi:hypothetical protein
MCSWSLVHLIRVHQRIVLWQEHTWITSSKFKLNFFCRVLFSLSNHRRQTTTSLDRQGLAGRKLWFYRKSIIARTIALTMDNLQWKPSYGLLLERPKICTVQIIKHRWAPCHRLRNSEPINSVPENIKVKNMKIPYLCSHRCQAYYTPLFPSLYKSFRCLFAHRQICLLPRRRNGCENMC